MVHHGIQPTFTCISIYMVRCYVYEKRTDVPTSHLYACTCKYIWYTYTLVCYTQIQPQTYLLYYYNDY